MASVVLEWGGFVVGSIEQADGRWQAAPGAVTIGDRKGRFWRPKAPWSMLT
jgi:hypothetical protein